jgi:hypothetical protein
MQLIFVILAVFLCQMAVGYPFQSRFSNLRSTVNCNQFPPALSYHIHVTYMLTNEEQIKEVSSLRDDATKEFADLLGLNPICEGTEIEPSGRYGINATKQYA